MATDLIASLYDRIWTLLSDSFEPHRWPNTALIVWVNEARLKLWQFRPDAFYVTKIVTAYPGDLASTAAIDVMPTYYAFLVNYTVARALGQDAEHAANITMSQFFSGMAGSDAR